MATVNARHDPLGRTLRFARPQDSASQMYETSQASGGLAINQRVKAKWATGLNILISFFQRRRPIDDDSDGRSRRICTCGRGDIDQKTAIGSDVVISAAGNSGDRILNNGTGVPASSEEPLVLIETAISTKSGAM